MTVMCGPNCESVFTRRAATAPPPENTAEAPVVNEGAKRQSNAASQRKGTSSLRIGLTLGGGMGGTNGGSQGVSIPR